MAVLKPWQSENVIMLLACLSRCTTRVVGEVKASQSAADGFVAPFGVVEDGGITVVEVWDWIGQHDTWFHEAVKPLLPPGTPEPTFVERHVSNTK
jgi:hypothetical protein